MLQFCIQMTRNWLFSLIVCVPLSNHIFLPTLELKNRLRTCFSNAHYTPFRNQAKLLPGGLCTSLCWALNGPIATEGSDSHKIPQSASRPTHKPRLLSEAHSWPAIPNKRTRHCWKTIYLICTFRQPPEVPL